MAITGTSDRTHTYTATRRDRTFAVPYDKFIRTLESLLGRMDPDALRDLPMSNPDEARRRLETFVGPSGLTIFQTLNHGALRTAFTGRPARALTYVFGNALIAIEMTKHIPEVGLYVPLRMFVEELGPAQVRVTYELPSSTLGQFRSAPVDAVARDLDDKVERLLTGAARIPASPSTREGRTKKWSRFLSRVWAGALEASERRSRRSSSRRTSPSAH